jgi:hypothetical protein
MSPVVEPQHSVVLVVGREQFTPPKSFGREACTATEDCVTIWGNTDSEPSEVLVQVAALADQTTSRSSDTA